MSQGAYSTECPTCKNQVDASYDGVSGTESFICPCGTIVERGEEGQVEMLSVKATGKPFWGSNKRISITHTQNIVDGEEYEERKLNLSISEAKFLKIQLEVFLKGY